MVLCTKCSYAWNPDTAVVCVQCKSPIAAETRRGDTLDDDLFKGNQRRQTIAEGISTGVPAPPPPAGANPAQPEIPQSRWNDGLSAERAERRRTVFAGAPAASESSAYVSSIPSSQGFSGPPSPSSSLSPSGSSPSSTGPNRRPQTIAVDPGRKIVGVLITYSWHEQGQVFPVLEGRNLIGRDPSQSDICIPQDATLSAVNSFITYRGQFIIGDKVSMSGTDVDGKAIVTEFVPLRNYANIRTGSTHWTFVAIQPPTPQESTPSSYDDGSK